MKVARLATPSSLSRMPSAVRQLALDVGQHGEGQGLQVGMVLAPGQMHELAVGRDAIDHGVAIVEVAVQLAEAGDLGRADEGEVLGPEEHQLPLALVGAWVKSLKAVLGSVETTPWTEKSGNLSPMVSMSVFLGMFLIARRS